MALLFVCVGRDADVGSLVLDVLSVKRISDIQVQTPTRPVDTGVGGVG